MRGDLRNLSLAESKVGSQGQISKYLIFCVVVVFVFGLFGLAYPQDPGIPDTVRFEKWGVSLPCPPCSGKAIVPIVVVNDDFLYGMHLPFEISQQLTLDTAFFVGERGDYMDLKGFQRQDIWGNEHKIRLSGIDYSGLIPLGKGIMAYLYLNVSDSGVARIDTTTFYTGIPEGIELLFALPDAQTYTPQFIKTEFYLKPSVPGDVNQDGSIGLSDIVFLAGYIFGVKPYNFCWICSDVNHDCKMTLADVVYLARYILSAGPSPQMGCNL